MNPNVCSTGVAATAILAAFAAALGACAQIVGGGFDDVHLGDPRSGASGSHGGDASLPGPGDDGVGAGNGDDASASGGHPPHVDGGIPIDDDGGTVFFDAACNGATTTLKGTVYDPSGKTPLYGVLVYVPTSPLAPMPTTLGCDRCGAPPSGDPVASTTTRPDGTFTLPGVPAGTQVPLVVQTGKWRRLTHVPVVSPCVPTTLTDPELTRLPRSGSEGSMPRIALVTGQTDPFECVFLKMGIDASEFTAPRGAGHVTLYQNNGAYMGAPPVVADGGTQADALYASAGALAAFDQVFLGCEGAASVKSGEYAQSLASYVASGGRAWLEHFELAWLQAMPPAYASRITFTESQTALPDTVIHVDTSFPKGAALAAWLTAVGATTVPGQFSAPDTRTDIAVAGGARSWMTAAYTGALADGGSASVQISEQSSFLAPPGLPASQSCGRVMFSDFHSGEVVPATLTFPGECQPGALEPEGKAFEFAFFDLGGCIQDE